MSQLSQRRMSQEGNSSQKESGEEDWRSVLFSRLVNEWRSVLEEGILAGIPRPLLNIILNFGVSGSKTVATVALATLEGPLPEKLHSILYSDGRDP